jgi:RES domain
MTSPQDLRCPDPDGCPVVAELPPVPGVWLDAGVPLYRVYSTRWGYDEFNPGLGDTRFAPFDAAATGARVPTMYLAGDEIGALLETVFHEVHHQLPRRIYEKDLRRFGLAHVRVPRRLWLADLRDPALAAAGVRREQLVSTPAEHYPCTRRVARDVHGREIDGREVAGLLWHSRQAELLATRPTEVCVLFGDVAGTGRGSWVLTGPGVRNLFEGPGRVLVDVLAEQLDATVHPAD